MKRTVLEFFESVGTATIGAFDYLFPIEVEQLPIPPPPIKPPPATRVDPPITGFLVGWYGGYDGRWPICATDEELDRHMLLVGSTGSGKTTLITRLFVETVRKECLQCQS